MPDLLQQQVAVLMSAGIVKGLEVIQVDQQQRDIAARTGADGNGLLDPVGVEAAVGKPCQRVEESQRLNFLLGALSVGDIFRQGEQILGSAVIVTHDQFLGVQYAGAVERFDGIFRDLKILGAGQELPGRVGILLACSFGSRSK